MYFQREATLTKEIGMWTNRAYKFVYRKQLLVKFEGYFAHQMKEKSSVHLERVYKKVYVCVCVCVCGLFNSIIAELKRQRLALVVSKFRLFLSSLLYCTHFFLLL